MAENREVVMSLKTMMDASSAKTALQAIGSEARAAGRSVKDLGRDMEYAGRSLPPGYSSRPQSAAATPAPVMVSRPGEDPTRGSSVKDEMNQHAILPVLDESYRELTKHSGLMSEMLRTGQEQEMRLAEIVHHLERTTGMPAAMPAAVKPAGVPISDADMEAWKRDVWDRHGKKGKKEPGALERFGELLPGPLKFLARPGVMGAAGVTGTLAAANATLGLAQQIVTWGHDVEQGFSWRGVQKGAFRAGENLPLVGNLFRAHTQFGAEFLSERNLTAAQQNQQIWEYGVSLRAQHEQQRRALRMQSRDLAEEYLVVGHTSEPQRFALTQERTRLREEALARAGRAGYGREAEAEDISRRYGLALQIEQQQIEARRRAALASGRVQIAERQRRELAEQERTQRGAVAVAAATVTQARAGGDPARLQEARVMHMNQLVALEATQRQLAEATEAVQARQVERLHEMQRTQQERVNLLQQERNTLTSIIQQERSRRAAMTESLGLMMPKDQASILRIARKIQAGGAPTFGELRYMQQHRDVFQAPLQEIGQARGAPIMEQLLKMDRLALQKREQQAAEQRVKIDNAIKIELNTNTNAMKQQIIDVLGPALQNQQHILEQMIHTALSRFGLQARAANRAAGGG
jgi:hypothetical protein